MEEEKLDIAYGQRMKVEDSRGLKNLLRSEYTVRLGL